MPRNPPKILMVEDEAPIRNGVTVGLRRLGYEVRAEPDGREINDVVRHFNADIVILDVRLPGGGPDGYEIARRLRQSGKHMPVLFLSAADDLRSRLDGFKAGADDYLVKPFAMDELLARIKALLRRPRNTSGGSWRVEDLVVDGASRSVTRAGVKLNLTRTEYELLAALMGHVSQVMTKSQLLSLAWGFDAYDENVVEVHVSSLRRKLEAHGPRLVHTVRGVGYVLSP